MLFLWCYGSWRRARPLLGRAVHHGLLASSYTCQSIPLNVTLSSLLTCKSWSCDTSLCPSTPESCEYRPALQACVAKTVRSVSHTTHQFSPQKIHYRHHPFYGAEVEVCAPSAEAERRFCRPKCTGISDRCSGLDLDAIHCSRYRKKSSHAWPGGTAGVSGPHRYSAALPSAASEPKSDASPQTGAICVKTKDRLSTSKPGLRPEGPVEKFPNPIAFAAAN